MTENDQTITIESPEHTKAQVQLAGIGTRSIAYVIDKLIQTGLILGATVIALLLLVLTAKISSAVEFFTQLRDSLGWWLLAPIIATYELITKGYFILFEYLWDGSTPGKRSQGIRVIRKDGRPISFLSAIIRNLLRVVDVLADIYPLGLVVMFIDRRNRRLGDMAAGTLVVREEAISPLETCSPYEEPGIGDDDIYTVALEITAEDYDLVKKYLARRDALDADYRQDLARQILDRVSRRSISARGYASDPEAFLEKLDAICRRAR